MLSTVLSAAHTLTHLGLTMTYEVGTPIISNLQIRK